MVAAFSTASTCQISEGYSPWKNHRKNQVVPRAPAFVPNDLVVSFGDIVCYTFHGMYVDDDS